MPRMNRWLVAAAACLALAGAQAAQAKPKKERGVFRAEKAGWMLGMYVGEQKGYPYPFVLQLDQESDAAKKGINTGDELIRFGDQEIYSIENLFDKVTLLRPGRRVKVWMRRGAETLPFELKVPKEPGAPPASEKAAAGKKDDTASKDGDQGTDDQKGKKKKKKSPVVIKPIPTENQ